jgi:hypothetical protein
MEKRKKKQRYERIEVYEEDKDQISRLAFDNDVTIKELASEMLQRMLVEHKDETKQIIKEMRMRKGID